MAEQQPFVHLHVHSEYSLLDGLSRIKHLAERAKSLNMPALALTDHGAMYGAIHFYRACKAAGIKPILGIETYVAARRMTDKDPNLDRERFHLLLLAHNQTGYQNLLKIASDSQLAGHYYKPRIDHEYLEMHSEGLIATTGCMAAEIPRAIHRGQMEKAHRLMDWYVDLFGRERFFVELQEHTIPELRQVNQVLLEMAPRYGLPFLATNDVHYTFAEEATPHDVLLCIQTGKNLDAKDRLRLSDQSYYLKAHGEMAALFGHVPGALENSLLIAEMCQVNPEPEGYHLPLFDVPEGFTAGTYLRQLCEEGLVRRYGEERAASDPALRGRLEHELTLIHQMGFDTYFLIVWDLCEFARGQGIWWNVRGSGAGSLVAYTLGITGIDPLAHGLIFERFLNPGRVSMPDIDLDYPDDRRHEMIEYTVRKYGSDKVAQIITFGTLGARAAIRDVGRALGVPLPQVDAIARLVPAIPGKPVTIDNVLDPDHEFYSAELKEKHKNDEGVRRLLETARNLEGVARHASTHAAGVIITDRPLVEYAPLHRPTSHNGEPAQVEGMGVVTQWDMEILESIGLLKIDFLGLSTLTILRRATELIAQRHGVRYTMENIPYDVGHMGPDPGKRPEALFELLGRGDVMGVFQVVGAGMRRLMMDMKPTRFDHIIAAISLYRPGPMENIPEYIARMHGRSPVKYHHPALEPILKSTYGILVYQEDIIRIASELAGYAPGDADMIRKAVGKKKKELIDEHRSLFIEGAISRGYPREVCEAIWSDIEYFARYGFNKSHAADYAVITCQTAFLKAHYPVEYMTALLSVERDNTAKIAQYLADARRQGITVAPPDINVANLDFTIEGEDQAATIRYGLGAIKNVGVAAIEVILQERAQSGPFADLKALCERVDLRRVGKRALESMVKVGVFDGWGTRPQLLDALDRLMAHSGSTHDAAAVGQLSLLNLMSGSEEMAVELLRPASALEAVDEREILNWEKELIGVYLSDHPLTRALDALQNVVTATTADLDEMMNGRVVTVAGLVTHARNHTTKKGEPMAFVGLEDLQGNADLVFFPRAWAEYRNVVKPEQVIVVRGKVQAGEEGNGVTILVDWASTTLKVAAEDGRPTADGRPPKTNGQAKSNGQAEVSYDQSAKANGRAINDRDAEMAFNAALMPLPPPNFDNSLEAGNDDNAGWPAEWRLPATPTPAAPAVTVSVSAWANEDEDWPSEWRLPPTAAAEEPPASPNPALPANGQSVGHVSNVTSQHPALSPQHFSSPKIVTVQVSSSSDWRRTFRQSLLVAGRFEGVDRIMLTLADQGLVMDFPNQRTRCCPELMAHLQALPGVMQVQESPAA